MRAAAAALAVTAVIGGAAGTASPAQAEKATAARPTVTLSGQEIVMSLVADLAYFYRHEVRDPPRFALTGGGTNAGIADAVRGISDGAMVSRDLAGEDPRGLTLTRLARSGVCLVSNRTNPVPSLTRAQLQGLVAGRLTSWADVPGAARADAISPVALASSTGAGRVFDTVFVDDATPVLWKPVTVLTGPQVRSYVEQTPAAFGYLDLSVTASLHVIAYEGIACTRQTIRDGTYPARRPFGVVTRGRPTAALSRFLRWARTSATARRVIALRYIPG